MDRRWRLDPARANGGTLSDTGDEGLRAAFAVHGEVTDAKVISDRDTGRSRGFGFVTFTDAADADAAEPTRAAASHDVVPPLPEEAPGCALQGLGAGGHPGGRRFGVASPEEVGDAERRWARYRKQHGLDRFGKRPDPAPSR